MNSFDVFVIKGFTVLNYIIIIIIKVLSLAVFLAALDILFIQHACTNTITKGASVQADQLFFFHQLNYNCLI